MKQPYSKVDKVSIEARTNAAKQRVEYIVETGKKMIADSDKVLRRDSQLCHSCFYIRSRMGGSTVTHRECGVCQEVQTYGSTATDAMCMGCAKHNSLCKQCGGDIDMKLRRSRVIESKPKEDDYHILNRINEETN